MFNFFVFDWKYLFWGKFSPKHQNYQFKLKFGSWPNSNIQNSMMLFTFSVFDRKCPFGANLVQIVNIVSLRWNLIPRLMRICRIEWWLTFFVFHLKCPFCANLVQKIKIVNLSWNLVPKLIKICSSVVASLSRGFLLRLTGIMRLALVLSMARWTWCSGWGYRLSVCNRSRDIWD